ncbi:hypothetical protein FOIG_16792 [Fusarium odoratissimum NRRL 54006]|uniref:Uncharacterized protein n=2 Tax=Fusarium oxysporum species complex TaxID=171631 RepID=X0IM60_FUSO5|nr:uncharacterized protein FOIG_16792 [Fusarium odoratissimum NRRL 54006]EXL89927.1 hypothetical protein FOIG_16792 [Fusarium odoratissimum NRRL 54006]TXB97847.1 hypothetical protein FocTR4_00017138 [Fusarium oxysporum f. sp. cubense]
MTPLFDVKSIESSGETDEQSRGATRQLEDTVTEMRMTTRKTTRKQRWKGNATEVAGFPGGVANGNSRITGSVEETNANNEGMSEALARLEETVDEMEEQMTERSTTGP